MVLWQGQTQAASNYLGHKCVFLCTFIFERDGKQKKPFHFFLAFGIFEITNSPFFHMVLHQFHMDHNSHMLSLPIVGVEVSGTTE